MSTDKVPDDLITRRQAAETERVSITTIKRMITRGELRRWRRGGRVFLSRAEVHERLTPRLVSA